MGDQPSDPRRSRGQFNDSGPATGIRARLRAVPRAGETGPGSVESARSPRRHGRLIVGRLRLDIWRKYWRLLLAVKLCYVLVAVGARPIAERIAPLIGGPLVTRDGLTRLLDALEFGR